MICSAYGNDLSIFYYLLTGQTTEYFLRIRRAGGRLRGRSFFWQFVNDTLSEASGWVMLMDPQNPSGSTYSLLKDGTSMPSFLCLQDTPSSSAHSSVVCHCLDR